MPSIVVRIDESALADLEAIRTRYKELGTLAVGDRLVREIVPSSDRD